MVPLRGVMYTHNATNQRGVKMQVKKILTTNVKNINPAYAGNVFFQRSEKNSKNGLTRYGKPIGSIANHQSYLLLGRCPKTGRFVSPKAVSV